MGAAQQEFAVGPGRVDQTLPAAPRTAKSQFRAGPHDAASADGGRAENGRFQGPKYPTISKVRSSHSRSFANGRVLAVPRGARAVDSWVELFPVFHAPQSQYVLGRPGRNGAFRQGWRRLVVTSAFRGLVLSRCSRVLTRLQEWGRIVSILSFGTGRGWKGGAEASFAGALVLSLVVTMGPMSPTAARAVAPVAGEVTPVPSGAVQLPGGEPDQPEGLERPDGFSAMAQARVLNAPVEDVSQRTQSARTFANPDGSWTTEDVGTAVRVQREGQWLDVDLRLEQGADGTWAPRVAPVDVVVAGGGDEAGRVTFEDGSSIAVAWPNGDLPEPVVHDGTATFAVSETTDLLIVTSSSGLKAWLRVNEPPTEADPTFSLELRSQGVDLVEAHGGLAIRGDDGELVGSASQLVAWDSRVDAAGDVLKTVVLDAELSKGVELRGERSQELVLATPEGFWEDPELQFPVIIDPDISFVTKHRDTWVRQGVTATKGKDERLLVGATGGGNEARALLKWQEAQFAGTTIVDASMTLYQYYADSCTKSITTEVRKLAAGFTEASTVWSNKPGMDGLVTTFAQNRGADHCTNDNGPVTVPLKNLVTGWAAGTITNYGIVLKPPAANATNQNYGKRFCSFDYVADSTDVCRFASRRPTLSVTYSLPPHTPGIPGFSPAAVVGNWTRDARPTFTSDVASPGGDWGKNLFEVHTSTAGTSLITSCTSPLVASGSLASCRVPANLSNGSTYYVRAKTINQHNLQSTWSAWRTFGIDTAAPAQPTISATGYTSGQWRDAPPSSNTFTFATTSPDVARFQYKADNGAWQSTAISLGTLSRTFAWNPPVGAHSFAVRAVDRAGNVSTERYFHFGSGKSSLQTPTSAGAKVTDRIQVRASAPPPAAGTVSAKTQFRLRGGAWKDGTGMPVTTSNGASVVNAASDIAAFVAGEGRERRYTVVEVQVCFTYTSPSQTRCTWADGGASSHGQLVYVPHAFGSGFPVADAGPGQVALWTGEFQTSATDVSVPGYVGDLSISRNYKTYTDGVVKGPFGYGWEASVNGTDIGVAGFEVVDDTDEDGTILLIDEEGSALAYAQPDYAHVAQGVGVYEPLDEETATVGARLQVKLVSGVKKLVFTQDDGTVTTWAYENNGAWAWRAESVTEPGSSLATTFSYNSQGRVTRILAPVPPPGDGVPVTCGLGAEQPGCRALNITYATTNTATSATPGDRIGLVKAVSYTAFDPDKPGGAGMVTVPVATYAYDIADRLVAVTDPRLELTTTYTWAAPLVSGNVPLLTGVTPPGLAAYTLAYDSHTTEFESALRSVERAAATAGGPSAVLSTYRYDLSLATPGMPVLSEPVVTAWGQRTAPTRVFAVFSQDKAASIAPPPAIPSAGDLLHADLSFTDDEGYTINTAAHGAGDWQLTSTTYDAGGRVVRTLDEWAIAQIRQKVATSEPVDPDSYATITRYNSDIVAGTAITHDGGTITPGEVLTPAGTLITDTWEPAFEVTRSNGSRELVRKHTHTSYDQGAPNYGVNPRTGLAFRLPTTVTVTEADPASGSWELTVPVTTGETVVSKQTSGYTPIDGAGDLAATSGWLLGGPTIATIAVPGGADIVTRTRFDELGRTIESRQPASDGSDAGTTLTDYYTVDSQTGAAAACGGNPAWAGLACQTRSAESTPTVPTERTTGYSLYLSPSTVTETLGAVTRTTTTTYDAAGRELTSATGVTGLSASQPVANTKTEYDQYTGLETATVSLDAANIETGRIATAYDLWGRQVSYTDAAAQTTTTSYDTAGRVATIVNPMGMTSLIYDGAGEHRGVVTSQTTTGLGTMTATYGPGGQMLTQEFPGDLSQQVTLDRAGNEVSVTYDLPTGPLAAWYTGVDILGRIASTTGMSATGGPRYQTYTYDDAARLVAVGDTIDGICTQRAYTFDANGNRTALDTTTRVAGCDSPVDTTASRTWTYDTADRIQQDGLGEAGYVYDALGRQTLLPETDAPGGVGDVGVVYYDTDAVYSLTQDGVSTLYELDPAGRRAISTTTGDDTAITERFYTDSSDNPTWATTTEASNVVETSRYATSIGGDLGAVITPDDVQVTIPDPLGSVATTITLTHGGTLVGALGQYDEYGNTIIEGSETGTLDYGWLGAKERATDPTGLLLMGARLYNPVTGLFTSADPVTGGNTTAYAYPQDPINNYDIAGLAAQAVFAAAGIALRTAVTVLGQAILITIAAWVIIHGVKGAADRLKIAYAKATKKSGKEKASDIPSWAKGATRKYKPSGKNESADEATRRIMDKKYGKGKWKRSGQRGREYSQIKKFLDRSG